MPAKEKASVSTATAQPSLSIVIPCYNESNRLTNLFDAVGPFIRQWPAPVEVLIVDDGSTDDTVAKINAHPAFQQEEAIQLLQAPQNVGKGGALAIGVAQAKNDYILTLDADMSTHPKELLNWIKGGKHFSDNTIYIASREHKESQVSAQTSRRIVGNIFNFLVRTLTPLRSRDTQCGFKLYPANIAKVLFGQLKVEGWAHDVELLYRAHLQGLTIKDMPIHWQEEAGSKINVAKDSIRMLLQILFISGLLRWQYFVKEPLQALTGKYQASPLQDEKGHPIFRTLFAFSMLFLLFFMPAISSDFGITGDERVQYYYGEHLLDYFETFGADDTAQDCCPEAREGYRNLHYYGGFFDLLSAGVHHLFNFEDIWATRHAMNSLFGFLAILFAGLLAKRFGGYSAAFVTVLILVLTPRFFGHAMNNPKDIPFAATFIFSLYFLFSAIDRFPKPGFRNLLWLAVGIALTIAIRIGGLLLIGFVGLFALVEIFGRTSLRQNFGKDLLKYVKMGGAVILGGYLGGLLLWPYAHLDPIGNPLEALGKMSQFETGIRLLFQGEYMMSTEVPWHYELTYAGITFPLVLLVGLAIGLLALVLRWVPQRQYGLLWFAALFPLAYAIYQSSPLYDGMRHFLFIIPIAAAIAGIGWTAAARHLPKKVGPIGVAIAITALSFLPLRWMLANHPHHVVYFNEIAGGTSAALGQYETDYWYNSLQSTVDELIEKDNLINSTDTVVIVSNASFEVRTYFERKNIPVKTVYAKYQSEDNWLPGSGSKIRTNRRFMDYDYAIFVSRFMDLDELQNHWPPAGTYLSGSADGAALNIVMKSTSDLDRSGYEAFEAQDWKKAAALFSQSTLENPNSAMIWYYLGMAYSNSGQPKEAVDAYQQSLQVREDPIADQLPINLANAYLQNNQLQEAINHCNTLIPALDQQARQLQQSLPALIMEYNRMTSALQAQRVTQENIPDEYKQLSQDLYGQQQDLQRALQQLIAYYQVIYQAYQGMGNTEGMQQAGQALNNYTQTLQQYQR